MEQQQITLSLQQCHILAFRPDGCNMPELDQFIEASSRLELRSLICTRALVDAKDLDAMVEVLGVPKVNEPRTILLICGAYFERQISLATQFMLITGYPVLLLRDLIVANNPDLSQVHDHRLLQAGAVPTTSQQLMYEWAATETVQARRDVLNELLQADASR